MGGTFGGPPRNCFSLTPHRQGTASSYIQNTCRQDCTGVCLTLALDIPSMTMMASMSVLPAAPSSRMMPVKYGESSEKLQPSTNERAEQRRARASGGETGEESIWTSFTLSAEIVWRTKRTTHACASCGASAKRSMQTRGCVRLNTSRRGVTTTGRKQEVAKLDTTIPGETTPTSSVHDSYPPSWRHSCPTSSTNLNLKQTCLEKARQKKTQAGCVCVQNQHLSCGTKVHRTARTYFA